MSQKFGLVIITRYTVFREERTLPRLDLTVMDVGFLSFL